MTGLVVFYAESNYRICVISDNGETVYFYRIKTPISEGVGYVSTDHFREWLKESHVMKIIPEGL